MKVSYVVQRSSAVFFLFLLTCSANAQNVANNIRPVGSICLVGQACVGTYPGSAAESEINVAGAKPAENMTADLGSQIVEEAVAQSDFDAAGVYQMSCNACHGTGAAGAPMLGDAGAWEARLEKGMDALMSNVINGVGAMPARGICMTCSDDDLQAIVDYMLAQN